MQIPTLQGSIYFLSNSLHFLIIQVQQTVKHSCEINSEANSISASGIPSLDAKESVNLGK